MAFSLAAQALPQAAVASATRRVHRRRRSPTKAASELSPASLAALGKPDDVRSAVQEYYGTTLQSSDDLKTSACTSGGPSSSRVKRSLSNVPEEIRARYYGCGSPTPLGIEGLRVLDLGCGTGRDCYVASDLVGEKGSVVGVDMTKEQLDVARKYNAEYAQSLGYAETNMTFLEGQIEDLASAGVEPESIDLAISNCVINLAADKQKALSEVWNSLAWGGEFFFSDVYCDRRLPEAVTSHEVLVGECLGGALYEEDFRRIVTGLGWADPREVTRSAIAVEDEELAALLGEAKFYSITYRLFKLPEGRLETLCEDYGQYALYKGTIEGSESAYQLDDHHRIERNKPFLVCGNTAAMLEETWLGPHFEIAGDRATHYGLFPCGPEPAAGAATADCAPSSGGGACC